MAMKRALLILAEGAEEMEVVITGDVLRRAGVEVTYGGLLGGGPVVCARKTVITPDASFDEALKSGPHDVLILPGGMPGSQSLADSSKVGDAMRSQLSTGGILAAICAAPIALASHKIAPGSTITSYPGVRNKLEEAGYTYSDARVVVDGKLVTSRGPGTAFEFALKLVEMLIGDKEVAKLNKAMLIPK